MQTKKQNQTNTIPFVSTQSNYENAFQPFNGRQTTCNNNRTQNFLILVYLKMVVLI